MAALNAESAAKHLPSAAMMRMSGSKLPKSLATRPLSPLKTERTMMMAAVATSTPMAEMAEMMLMAFWLL